jgi:hypothetical protein
MSILEMLFSTQNLGYRISSLNAYQIQVLPLVSL